jgi:hypothetical protein
VIVIVSTARRRYAIRREDVVGMQLVAGPADLEELGTPERPALPVELCELLEPEARSQPGRRHGLVVPIRRRPVVFLVDRVEGAAEDALVQPLPALIARRLEQPWALGALEHEGELVVLIDLRSLARSVMAQRSSLER